MWALEEESRVTSYRLAFAKVQAGALLLLKVARNRERVKKQKAFIKLRANADQRMKKEEIESMIGELKGAVRGLMKMKARYGKFILDKFLCRWRDSVARSKLADKTSKELSIMESSYKKELDKKSKMMNGLEQKFRQQIVEVSALKESEKVLKQTLKDRERQEKLLKESTNIRKANTRAVEEKLQALEEYVLQLESENKDLKGQLGAAEENVGGFLKEINEIISSSELASSYLGIIQ
eukprot:TRINITY_DN13980_c0_g1_i9.p1 TRINITY_DN13980_c0_g1~~TRINITY_DN13980_c0_g1_i9.p1  ORF type:complete len:237 (+),score=74.40 TRINITY_DN13980_c0_g1_i9:167-877(+)